MRKAVLGLLAFVSAALPVRADVYTVTQTPLIVQPPPVEAYVAVPVYPDYAGGYYRSAPACFDRRRNDDWRYWRDRQRDDRSGGGNGHRRY